MKGSLVTETRPGNEEFVYSGISTGYGGVNMPKSNKLLGKLNNHIPSEILLWAGAKDADPDSIENSRFFVDKNGNMYAGSGYFEGTIITDATIKASEIETAVIRGSGNLPALRIEDAAKGIYFSTYNENNEEVIIFEVSKDRV